MPTPAVPQPHHIPSKDGEPVKFTLAEGPTDDECPRTVYALGIPATADMIRSRIAKMRALATLMDAEVPEGFDEALDEVCEAAEDGDTFLDADSLVICWN